MNRRRGCSNRRRGCDLLLLHVLGRDRWRRLLLGRRQHVLIFVDIQLDLFRGGEGLVLVVS